MAERDLRVDDPLEDFTRRNIELLGNAKLVYLAGSGPAVIVMTEMPGISPHVARFARWLRDAGFTVYMPHLFGQDGAVPTAARAVLTMLRGCISAEFKAFSAKPPARSRGGCARSRHRHIRNVVEMASVPSACVSQATSRCR